MSGLLKKAWRDLTRRRTRSLLAVLGVAVAVAGLVAVISTSQSVVRAQRELFTSTSQADITYWVGNAPANLVSLLESDPRITAADLRLSYGTQWRVGQSWMDIELVGIDDLAQVRVNQFNTVTGRPPLAGEVLLERADALAAGLAPGAEIAFRAPSGREQYLRLSGLSQSPAYLSSAITKTSLGYVPATYLRRLLNLSGSDQLLIKVRDPREVQEVVTYVNRLLRRQNLAYGTPDVRSPANFAGKRELEALMVMMFLFAALGIILSTLLVINTISATVAEQTGEIGILKSLGATRAQVLFLYLLEALAYGLVGTLLGMVIGVVVGWRVLVWIAALGNATVSFRVAPVALLYGALVGIGVALLGGFIPALQGTRVSVREALESYGITSDYGQGALHRALGRLRALPPLVAMALRSLGRRPARSALTLLVITLSTAAFLSATTTRDSVNAAINDIYHTYNADAYVWLGQTVGPQMENLFRSVEGVQAAEGWLIADGVVGLADARLWGIPAPSTLYRQVMRAGRWFAPGEQDVVVLSTELADHQHLRVGDRVEIQAQGQARLYTVIGIAVDNTIFLGGTLSGKAFLPREALARLMRQGESLSFFALGLASRARPTADDILATVERRFHALRPSIQPVYVEIEAAREASRLLTVALVAMVVLVALVGSLGILNTLTLNILERQREIAIMRVMGATNAAVVLVFLTEGLVFGGLGWLLGLAIGYPTGQLLTAQMGRVLFSLDYLFRAVPVWVSLAFALGLALLSSLGPALSAAQVRANAPLRYE